MKGEQILFPHVLRFFKGFGTMDCLNTIKKNVEVEYKEAVEPPIEVPIIEEVKVEPVIVKPPEPIPVPQPKPEVKKVEPPPPEPVKEEVKVPVSTYLDELAKLAEKEMEEDGIHVSIKPERGDEEWNPFEVAMHKHFKYQIVGLDWCYKLIDMTSKENLDEMDF